MPGARLFDNFYWFGDSSVGMWLVTSPQGYILFDAGNTQDDITKTAHQRLGGGSLRGPVTRKGL